MSHDCFEVFDADDYVHVLLHVEVFEILGVDRDGRFQRLLQHFCVKLAFVHIMVLNDFTFAILDLLCEAREDRLSIRCLQVELFSLWAKILDIFSEYSSRNAPALARSFLVEQSMHYFYWLIGQAISLGHP